MNAEQLYEMLRKVQESSGYFFNREREKVFDLLDGLLLRRSK